MDRNTFLRILETFADDPRALDRVRDQMILQMNDQVLEFQANLRGNDVYVTEDGVTERAEVWVRNRLGNLRLLAQRIIDVTPTLDEYIAPSGLFIDVLENAPRDQEQYFEDAAELLKSEVNKGAGLNTYVLFLTSDAGEGKTTTIQRLAVDQARRYLNKEVDSIIVPIYLAGQPFIRLDDMIVGSIANTFRFRNLYIESFIELVKVGAIIPAFDGFEEMFVVGSSGEAVSSLGNFIENTESSGRAIVSARTAYFEIRDRIVQARLFDSMDSGKVSFSRLKLQRWNEVRFKAYWKLRGLPDGDRVWDTLFNKFKDPNHALLSRAVLVSKLADIAEDETEFSGLLQQINRDATTYFAALVDSIIEREITSKWVERTEAKVSKPLLTLEQHHELLSQVAIEMAVSSNSEVSIDELNTIAEVYCEDQKIPASIVKLVTARLPDHPLLRKPSGTRRTLVFDHEEFRDFFSGEALGRFICLEKISDYKNMMRNAIITPSAVEACFVYLKSKPKDLIKHIDFLKKAMTGEDAASTIRESSTRILARMLTMLDGDTKVEVCGCAFEPDAFKGVRLSKIVFKESYFHRFDISSSQLDACDFIGCEFSAIEWDTQTSVTNATLDENCKVYEACDGGDELSVFSPEGILNAVQKAGFTVDWLSEDVTQAVESEPERDADLSITERALRAYQRSNGITESVFKTRLGAQHYSRFNSYILPELLRVGVVSEGSYKGQGKDSYYRLSKEMTAIEQAMKSSRGNFERFLSILDN